MRSKPWTDKEYLKRCRDKRMTIEEIAKDCETMGFPVTPMTIFNHLRDAGLLPNSRKLGKRSVGGTADKKKKGGFYS